MINKRPKTFTSKLLKITFKSLLERNTGKDYLPLSLSHYYTRSQTPVWERSLYAILILAPVGVSPDFISGGLRRHSLAEFSFSANSPHYPIIFIVIVGRSRGGGGAWKQKELSNPPLEGDKVGGLSSLSLINFYVILHTSPLFAY